MTELELKFCVPEAALASLREALRERGAVRTRLRAHYFDTACGALARHRVALRLRLEGRRWVQTLKAAGDGAVHRLEHEVRVPGRPGTRPALDLSLHDGTPAGAQLAAALRGVADAQITEQHATDIWRLHLTLQDGDGSLIEAALDTGFAMAAGRSAPVCELELEHKGGPQAGLFTLAQACVRHGGLWQSTLTKAERGMRLREPDDRPRAVSARAPRLPDAPDAAALMRALLQAALEQVLANASEMQPGGDNVEVVHQLRVGLRRLRVLLGDLAPLLPGAEASWAGTLAATFSRLGEQRDHVAVSAAVRPLLQAAGAPLSDWTPPPAADPVQVVREPAFQCTLLALQALAHGDAAAYAPLGHTAVRDLLAARLNRLRRRLQHAARHFEQLPEPAQHGARKHLKRLRYLLDFSAPLWPKGLPPRQRKALSAAQDALGLHQDVAVAAAALARESQLRPEAGFAAGYLQAYKAVTARAARRVLRAAMAHKPAWK